MTPAERVISACGAARRGRALRPPPQKALLLIVLLVAFCYLHLYAVGQQASQPLPDVTFRTYEDQTIRTGDLKGAPVFVFLWATHCKACIASRARIEDLDKRFAVQGVWFLSVNEDGIQQHWKDYLLHHPSPMTEVWDENHAFRQKIRGKLSTVLIVDGAGQIRWQSQWTATAESKVSDQLERLLREHPPK